MAENNLYSTEANSIAFFSMQPATQRPNEAGQPHANLIYPANSRLNDVHTIDKSMDTMKGGI